MNWFTVTVGLLFATGMVSVGIPGWQLEGFRLTAMYALVAITTIGIIASGEDL